MSIIIYYNIIVYIIFLYLTNYSTICNMTWLKINRRKRCSRLLLLLLHELPIVCDYLFVSIEDAEKYNNSVYDIINRTTVNTVLTNTYNIVLFRQLRIFFMVNFIDQTRIPTVKFFIVTEVCFNFNMYIIHTLCK